MSGHREIREHIVNAPLPKPLLEVQQDTGPALLLLVNESGAPVALNRTARQFLFQKEQVRWADIIHGDDLPSWDTQLQESLESQTQISGWFRLRRFDHAIRQFVLRAEPRYDVEGTFAGYLVSGLDVTDIGGKARLSSPRSQTAVIKVPTNKDHDSEDVPVLARKWHDALVKDATVLRAATQLLRDYLSTSDCDHASKIKALDQLEHAVGGICDLVEELNGVSRQA